MYKEKRRKLKYQELERGKLYKREDSGILCRLGASGLQFFDQNKKNWIDAKPSELLDRNLLFRDY